MNWVEGLVCISTAIAACFISDAICTTVRYVLGERPKRWTGTPPPPGEE